MRKVKAFTLAPVLILAAAIVLAHVAAFGVGYVIGAWHARGDFDGYDIRELR